MSQHHSFMILPLVASAKNPFANRLIVAFLVLMNVSAMFSQNTSSIKLNHFSSSHKMPGASVQCIFQDHIGVFWLGIESEGLTKYDGKSFTVYKNDPDNPSSISNNYLTKITEDKDGNLWVATVNGLNKFDRHSETFKRYSHAEGTSNTLANNVVNDLIIDEYGNLWIATSNGISILNPSKEEFLNLLFNPNDETPTSNIEVTCIEQDKYNNKWFGTQLHSIYTIPQKSYKKVFEQWKSTPVEKIAFPIGNIINYKEKLNNSALNNIRSLAILKEQTLWIGTNSGLFQMDIASEVAKKKMFLQPSHERLNYATYLNLLVDSRQNLWAGTSNDGLVLLKNNGTDITYLNADNYTSNQLKSNAIREIIESRSGLIWVATKFGGLHNYDKRQETFAHIKKSTPEQPGLSNEFVLCAFEDSRKNLWIGTKAGGLNLYDRKNNQFKVFNTQTTHGTLKSNRIETIAEDENGQLWLGTEGGLFKMNPTTHNFQQYSNLHIRNILCTKDGNLWLGTSFGLYRFSPSQGKMWPQKTTHSNFFDSESNIYITRVFEDRFGVMWIGTSTNGLLEYHPQNDSLFRHVNIPTDTSSISGNLIRSIHEDALGNLWVGTKSDGLNRFNRKTHRFEHFSNNSKLSSSTVYSILEDNSGNFWMGTHNGIVKYNPETGDYTNFGLSYGLQSLIFEINAFCPLSDGSFAIGGSQGLNIFRPEEVKVQNFSAPLIVSKFNITNGLSDKDIYQDKTYRLNYNDNYLSFEFALLDYSEPDGNTYAYKLENFDSDWVYSIDRNFVTYTNLPSGNYVFRVKGANADGDWTKKEIALHIEIPIPFWRSHWFQALVAILLLISVVLAYYLRTIVIKRQQAQLKALVDQRTQELTLANSQLEESKLAIVQRNEELLRKSKQIILQNQELEKHHRHLESLVTERTKDLEESKRKAEESDRLKSAFLANMSHEIRTPLNAIMGFIDILEDDELPLDEKHKINQIVQSNGNMLLQLINDIIDISIIEANQVKLHWNTIELNTFLKSILVDYENHKELNEKGIRLMLETPQNVESFQLRTAPERVKQIVTNLINNAIKFTSQGHITFGYDVDEPNSKIVGFVRDTGCGISDEDKMVIFNRFRKLDNDNTIVHRGTGLGLAICKNLCELLGGTIWVESKIGEGSTFFFTLSYAKQTDVNTEPTSAKELMSVPNLSRKTVLVAEDEESNFEVLKYMLRKTHVKIIRSHNGLEAVETVLGENHDIDLVLMDIKMPKLNGLEATKIIKEAFPNLPVVALSAYALQSEKTDYAQSGFEAYLTKPVNAFELYSIMQQLIGHN